MKNIMILIAEEREGFGIEGFNLGDEFLQTSRKACDLLLLKGRIVEMTQSVLKFEESKKVLNVTGAKIHSATGHNF